MTGFDGVREGKEMAIRNLNMNFALFSANRHFSPPIHSKTLSFRAPARNLHALVKSLLITDTNFQDKL
jgi:hypothetical protein